ncbi:MAG: hypothetical protein ACRENF_03220, partial [Thermodesulfobacteriota bacterium]
FNPNIQETVFQRSIPIKHYKFPSILCKTRGNFPQAVLYGNFLAVFDAQCDRLLLSRIRVSGNHIHKIKIGDLEIES